MKLSGDQGADNFAAGKERDFINTKEARRMLAGRLAEAKCVLKPPDMHADA